MLSRHQIASDVIRDGLGLELVDERGDVLAEVFRCDADHTLVLEVFRAGLPSSDIDALVLEAYRRLQHFEDGTSLPPRELLVRVDRDSSGALSFSLEIPADEFLAFVARVAAILGLRVSSSPIVGPETILQEFESDEGRISFQWDNWMAFTMRAETPESDALVRRAASACCVERSLTRASN